MWKKLPIPFLLAFFLVVSVSGVNVNTSLNLKMPCLDANGNLCTNVASWTILYPNGSTMTNNTPGGTISYGISNYSAYYDTVGTYFVLANFTGQNITGVWNVVVENYDTSKITEVWENFTMVGIYLLVMFVIGSLIYIAFKLDQAHKIMKWFLMITTMFLLDLAVGIARTASTNSSVSSLLDTLYYTFIVITVVMLFYILVFVIIISLVNMLKAAKMAAGGKGSDGAKE